MQKSKGHPIPHELELLQDLERSAVSEIIQSQTHSSSYLHSLLLSPIGVPLPLHISLSRPLVLKTSDKEPFTNHLSTSLAALDIQAFSVRPKNLIWHPNEDGTRWFLVLRVTSSCSSSDDDEQGGEKRELRDLLRACNNVAKRFGQPLLYASSHNGGQRPEEDHFHISIAWALKPPPPSTLTSSDKHDTVAREVPISEDLRKALEKTEIAFDQVKLRIGQDVTNFPLRSTRTKS
jgi:hypothetical protein